MQITKLSFCDFRNLASVELAPAPSINVIYGDNAQGKTNLLEAIWLFTGDKSFRGAKDAEMVRLNRPEANVYMEFQNSVRDNTARLVLSGVKSAFLNGVKLPGASRLAGAFYAVVFSPDHLDLVKSGPKCRREFLDSALTQLRPRYAAALGEYERNLAQRNALLKNARYGGAAVIEAFDTSLARCACVITRLRREYTAMLQQSAAAVYAGISRGAEALSVVYSAGIGEDCRTEQDFAQVFAQRLQADLAAGFTTAGPHRDDLELRIDGLSCKRFASQGQQRSAALALKVAESEIVEKTTGETPVVLLDDVLSELDVRRQDFVLNSLGGRQVFLTCCDPSSFSALSGGAVFQMKQGQIV